MFAIPAQSGQHAAPPPLAEALEKSETVQAAVQQSVTELLVINMVLQQEVPADALAGDVAQALQQTEKIETLLQDSADELARVNRAPKRETDEREDLEQALQQGQRQTGAGRRAQMLKRPNALTGAAASTQARLPLIARWR